MTTRGEEIERQYQEAEGDDFKVYSMGLFHSSVCSSLGEEETVRRMQSLPSGTIAGYSLAEDKAFETGEPNPCPCNVGPETHTHYLFEA